MQSLSIICVGTLFIFSMKFPIVAFTLNILSRNTLFVIHDFNYRHNPSIKLSSGLYGGKNINSILSLFSSKNDLSNLA